MKTLSVLKKTRQEHNRDSKENKIAWTDTLLAANMLNRVWN